MLVMFGGTLDNPGRDELREARFSHVLVDGD